MLLTAGTLFHAEADALILILKINLILSPAFQSVGKFDKLTSSQTSPPELPPAVTGVTFPSEPIPRTLPEF